MAKREEEERAYSTTCRYCGGDEVVNGNGHCSACGKDAPACPECDYWVDGWGCCSKCHYENPNGGPLSI